MIPKIFTPRKFDKKCYIILEEVQETVTVRIVNEEGDYLSAALVQFISTSEGVAMRLLAKTNGPVSQGDEIYIVLNK